MDLGLAGKKVIINGGALGLGLASQHMGAAQCLLGQEFPALQHAVARGQRLAGRIAAAEAVGRESRLAPHPVVAALGLLEPVAFGEIFRYARMGGHGDFERKRS